MFQIENNLNLNNCMIGILIISNINSSGNITALEVHKKNIESNIVKKYGPMTRKELKNLYPIDKYVSYYKNFGYTYHVLPQVESIAKGKLIPSISPIVTSMFMAEIKNMVLSAGHDLDLIKFPLILDTSSKDESYIGMSGKLISTVENDFIIKDSENIMSSILKGPDKRTAINKNTKNALFAAYAPDGISADTLHDHLNDIELFIKTFSPDAVTELKKVY